MPRITAQARESNREKLLMAAADEFAAAGLKGANINRISLAAGLAKGTVYNHFESKEALFFAVIEEACARAVAEAEDDPTATARERLRTLLRSDMNWVRKHEAFARVFVREALTADPQHQARVLASAAPFITKVIEILDAGVARGEVRADTPTAQLALVFVGLDDLALLQHWGSDGAWPTLDQIPDLVVGQFLDGAAPRDERKDGSA